MEGKYEQIVMGNTELIWYDSSQKRRDFTKADTRIEQIELTLQAVIYRQDQLATGIGTLDSRLDVLDARMAQGFASVQQDQRTMLDLMMSKLAEVQAQIAAQDQLLDRIDARFDQVIALIGDLRKQ